jgi:glycosyltransferase involved in cell wall biosynthesis
LVSVLIPAHNSERYVGQAIESALAQTHKHLEIVVIDDGSEDGTFHEASRFSSKGVRVFRESNRGACAARNTAFALSHGDYVQYLDADDLVGSQKIECQVRVLQRSERRVAFCPTVFFRDGVDPFQEEILTEDELFLRDYPSGIDCLAHLYGLNPENRYGMISSHAWLTPRQIIEAAGGWNEELEADQDGEFFCRVLLQSEGVLCTRDVKVFYRKGRKDSVSAGRGRRAWLSRLAAVDLKREHVSNHRAAHLLDAEFARAYLELGIAAYPEHQDVSARALARAREIGGTSQVPVLGGPNLERIKRVFGWRVARRLSSLRRRARVFAGR